jgi:hypothetical protein
MNTKGGDIQPPEVKPITAVTVEARQRKSTCLFEVYELVIGVNRVRLWPALEDLGESA